MHLLRQRSGTASRASSAEVAGDSAGFHLFEMFSMTNQCFDEWYCGFSILSGENCDFRQADILSLRLDGSYDKLQPCDIFWLEGDFFSC